MATQAFTFAVNASSTAVNITNNINTTIYAIAGGVDISVIPKGVGTDATGYDTIVINSIGIPPNILGQSLQIKTNFIDSVGGVDVSAYNTTQLLNAIMSLMASVATMSVTISGTPNINLTKVNGTTISLGQTTMAASLPVVIASNQSAVAVTLPTGSNTLTKTSVTANTSTTTVAAGAYSVTFSDLAGAACMIDNVTRASGNVYVFEASIGKTLPAIQYSTGATSTMTIETLT